VAIRLTPMLPASLACVVAGVPSAPGIVPDSRAVARGVAVQHTASHRSLDAPAGWWTRSLAPAVWQAPNRSHDYRTSFTSDGIQIVPRTLGADGGKSPKWAWGLMLTAYGRTPVAPAMLAVSGNRIDHVWFSGLNR